MTLSEIAIQEFAKSRFYKDKFINVNSGVYFSITQAVETVAFLVSADSVAIATTEAITRALLALPEITQDQAEVLNAKLPRWIFFDGFFDGRHGQKLSMLQLYGDFCATEPVNSKQFYTYFNCWVSENQHKVNFLNRLASRKVILVKS